MSSSTFFTTSTQQPLLFGRDGYNSPNEGRTATTLTLVNQGRDGYNKSGSAADAEGRGGYN